MATATHTLTGDLGAIVGEIKSYRATVRVNSEDGSWIDPTGEIKLGSAVIADSTRNPTGQFTVALPTSTGTDLEYCVDVSYKYMSAGGSYLPGSWSSGFFPMTADANLRDKAGDTNLRVSAPAMQRIDGVTDHGSISGSLELDSDISTHWLDATGPTVLSFTDGPSGGTRYVSVWVGSGASDVTVADLEGVTLTDGAFATFAWVRGAWILAGAGGSSAPADTTPPSAVTGLVATGGAGQIVLDWSDATDAESTVSYRYRAWLTSGGATGAWTTTTTSAATITGLAAGAYTAEVYAYSAGGASATATATATVTEVIDIADDFNAANITLAGRVTPIGSKTWVTPWDLGLGTTAVEIRSNKATLDGGARVLPDEQDYIVSCAYDVTASTGSGTQVRLAARAHATAPASTGTSAIVLYIRGDGALKIDYGNNYGLTQELGTGRPSTGTLALEVIGSTGRALINGAQVGPTFSLTGLANTYLGIGTYGNGKVDDFKVVYL